MLDRLAQLSLDATNLGLPRVAANDATFGKQANQVGKPKKLPGSQAANCVTGVGGVMAFAGAVVANPEARILSANILVTISRFMFFISIHYQG